ncbi:hypothetical protein RFI_09578 [Reticulomyxa filosa]|uniref:STI1/HOP DP domain-containing protein n=1 Tax=Reticulomyxa filosa TaxID=46433 RepID=X6NPD7_RETFI|nr:hypothetical protein RFI_09578 [Reticulomyxa filosa]|eukprot:ETO27554.1 hypothetical protein RFI_09578 [Reticulomyxa filosa]
MFPFFFFFFFFDFILFILKIIIIIMKKYLTKGLKIEPNNSSLKEGLEECEAAQRADDTGAGGGGGGRGLFGPEIWPMIHANPELRAFAADKDFIQKVNMLQNNPQMAMQLGLLQDPKIQKLFEVMLGMKMGPEEGDSGDAPESGNAETEAKEDHEEDEDDAEHGNVVIEGENEKKKEAEKEKEKETASEEKTGKTSEELEQERQEAEEQKKKEEDALRRRREEQQKEKEAEAQKAKGNQFYEQKTLMKPCNVIKRPLKSIPKILLICLTKVVCVSVLFMQEKWDTCIEKCQEAIVLCRQYFCDLKWTFKAFSRMGSVEEKRGNKGKALEYYRKALLEQKDETLKKRVKQMEREVEQEREKAYLDPEKSQQHKEQGNNYFKQGKWQDAIAEYTEAIRRNPKEPLLYSNRATAYCKLMGWEAALKDCETCLKIDPTFIKALIRQGKIYHVLKQYHKSLLCYRKAAEIDANNSDLKAAKQDVCLFYLFALFTMRAIQERNMSGEVDDAARQRVLEDPDIKSAMNDPEVSSVLLQAQSGDQSILFRAMRDKPRIAEKIELLVAAGVLQMVSR